MIAGHIAISLENGFQRSKITLPPQKFAFKIGRRGVKLPPPEIRVAAQAG